jgi:hypothetical protein
MNEKTLIEYVVDYLNEEITRYRPESFGAVSVQNLVNEAIDSYNGGAR